MSITNIIEGASAVGTIPRMGAIQAPLPTPYVANCHHLQAVAMVKLVAGQITSLVNYVPIPQGSVILDAYLDPVVAPTAGFTISLGNETAGDADFGSIAVIISSTVRVNAAGGTVGANYAGVRGNSVKLTFSALPTALAASEAPHLDKGKAKLPEKNDKAKHTKEEPSVEEKGPPYGTYTLAATNGHTDSFAAVAPLAADLVLLMTAMNATTDTLVSISNPHPEVGPGMVLQIGSEQMTVQRVTDAQNFIVARGSNSTTKAAHAVNAPVVLNAATAAGAFFGVLVIRFLMM